MVQVVLVPEKEATVYYDETITIESICEQIEDCGFSTKILKNEENVEGALLEKRDEFIIEGMVCTSCTSTINSQLADHVLSCDISLGTKNRVKNRLLDIKYKNGFKTQLKDCADKL